LTGGPSSIRLELVLDKTPPDSGHGIVVSVEFFPTLQPLKPVTITVVFVREPALAVTHR